MITINSDSKLSDVQTQFNACYPYLKLEFFKQRHHGNQLEKYIATPVNSFNTFAENKIPILININKSLTIAALEQQLLQDVGLTVQVYRKSGKVWNAISITDNWTLESQNKAGEFISSEMAGNSR